MSVPQCPRVLVSWHPCAIASLRPHLRVRAGVSACRCVSVPVCQCVSVSACQHVRVLVHRCVT
eukprot:4828716-Alexandrium_andersonii.AAC.1